MSAAFAAQLAELTQKLQELTVLLKQQQEAINKLQPRPVGRPKKQ